MRLKDASCFEQILKIRVGETTVSASRTESLECRNQVGIRVTKRAVTIRRVR